MRLFKDMFKDISETGSKVGKLRNKIVDLSELLVAYSFKQGSSSPELIKQKIIVTFNEAHELAEKCSVNERVRIYFPSKTVEPIIPVAMKAAEYWIDNVLEQGKQFTNSLAMLLLERAENDLKNQALSTTISSNTQTKLSNHLQNFVIKMDDMATVMPNCFRSIDTPIKLEYKAPILTYGRIMGYNHFIVEKTSNGNFIFYHEARGNNGEQFNTSKKSFSLDLSLDQYEELFKEIISEIAISPQYIRIATSGF